MIHPKLAGLVAIASLFVAGCASDVKLDDKNEGAMADPFIYDAKNVEEFAKIF